MIRAAALIAFAALVASCSRAGEIAGRWVCEENKPGYQWRAETDYAQDGALNMHVHAEGELTVDFTYAGRWRTEGDTLTHEIARSTANEISKDGYSQDLLLANQRAREFRKTTLDYRIETLTRDRMVLIGDLERLDCRRA